jgi:hypothetical protein
MQTRRLSGFLSQKQDIKKGVTIFVTPFFKNYS